MTVTVRYFASVRELIGRGEEAVELPEFCSTVGQLRGLLVARGGAYEEALGGQRLLRMACDQVMCGEDAALADGAEVAFFPPVTGG
ncbi:MAG: molybdopterin converting factor subunit 1 [Telluria sp.]